MVEQFAEELERSGKSRHTVKAYRERVIAFLEWLNGRYGEEDPTGITSIDIREYLGYCKNVAKFKPSGIHQRLSAIKAYTAFLEAQGFIAKDQATAVKPIKVTKTDVSPNALTEVEFNRFRREVEKHGNLRDKAIVEVLARTGVRVSELVAIEVDDIEISERKGMLFVRNGKGGKHREIPLAVEVRSVITDYMGVRPSSSSKRLFLGQRGPLTTDAINKMLRKYSVRVGLEEKIHPHAFRHYFASRLVRVKKEDIVVVAELLGHSSITTTQVYAKPTAEEKARAVEGLYE